MNCEWCGSPYGIRRADGTVTCPECRLGFFPPSKTPRPRHSLLVVELLVIALVIFLAWKLGALGA